MSEVTQDTITLQTQEVDNQPERFDYIVAVPSGIFKNGKLYKKGRKIKLDAKTAENFLAIGDIEEVSNA